MNGRRVCPLGQLWRLLYRRSSLLLIWLLVVEGVAPAMAHHDTQHRPPGPLADVAFDQRLNAEVPLDAAFRDEGGHTVRLAEYFGQRPVILVLAYYDCPMLCPYVLEGLLRSLRVLAFNIGEQFDIVTVSFAPRETPALAARTKERYVRDYARPGAAAGWHFLTGEEEAIRQLTTAVGFRPVYDAETGQYAHAAGIMVLTPQGRIARYLYGIEFSARDLRLALVESAANQIGSPIDQLLLYCYRYDPQSGKYSLLVLKAVRLAGLATVLGLGGFLLVMFRRDRAAQSEPPPTQERW